MRAYYNRSLIQRHNDRVIERETHHEAVDSNRGIDCRCGKKHYHNGQQELAGVVGQDPLRLFREINVEEQHQ
jgi:hypothetical protein